MKLLTTLFFLLITFLAQSQHPFDEYIRKRPYVNCEDVSYNAYDLISRFYSEQKMDSLYQFLDYWEVRCGSIGAPQRLRTVLYIRSGMFDPTAINSNWIFRLLSYKESLSGFSHDYYYDHHWGPVPYDRSPQYNSMSSIDSVDALTRQIARETETEDLDEKLILEFYSTETPDFESIKNAPNESRLKQGYDQVYEETRRMGQSHIAVATGIVQHYGNVARFGDRPNIGFIMGGKNLRHNYDFILAFRIGPSRQPYSFRYQDSIVNHKDWTGMYVGFEYTYDFVDTRRLDIGISGGIGYDRITALHSENDIDEDPKFLNSFNKNGGLVIKFHPNENDHYFGLHLRYNWVNYHNPEGTALDGEYFNIRFTFGGIFNHIRTRRLRNLR